MKGSPCYHAVHPGVAAIPTKWRRMAVPPEQGIHGHLPATLTAWGAETVILFDHGWCSQWNADWTTELTEGANALVEPFSTGIHLQCGTGSLSDTALKSVRTHTLASGKVWSLAGRFMVADGVNTGFGLGFASTEVNELRGSDPTDGVFFRKGTPDSELKGYVVANGGALHATSSLLTTPIQEWMELGIAFRVDSQRAWGEWYVDGNVYPFTQAQIEALSDMLADSPPTLCAIVGYSSGVATVESGWVESMLACADR